MFHFVLRDFEVHLQHLQDLFASDGSSGVVFLLEASALQFNAQHNVDFNTWIRDGIPYMSREDRKGKKLQGI